MKPTSTIVSNAYANLLREGASLAAAALWNARHWHVWYHRGRPQVLIEAANPAHASILALATRSITGSDMEGSLDRAFDRDLPHLEWVQFHIVNSETLEEIA